MQVHKVASTDSIPKKPQPDLGMEVCKVFKKVKKPPKQPELVKAPSNKPIIFEYKPNTDVYRKYDRSQNNSKINDSATSSKDLKPNVPKVETKYLNKSHSENSLARD